MKPIYYSEKTDRHIYGIKDGARTDTEWLEVAIAALDQAGLGESHVRLIRKVAEEFMELNYPTR